MVSPSKEQEILLLQIQIDMHSSSWRLKDKQNFYKETPTKLKIEEKAFSLSI